MAKHAAQAARLEGSRWTPYLFVAPVAVYLLLFQGYPLLQELMLSFTSTSLLSPSDHTLVGGQNYVVAEERSLAAERADVAVGARHRFRGWELAAAARGARVDAKNATAGANLNASGCNLFVGAIQARSSP